MHLHASTLCLRFASVLALCAVSCSSKDSTPTTTGPSGGPVTGTKDAHCGTKTQAVAMASCSPPPTDDAGTDGAAMDTGGMETGDPMQPTMFNDEGDDDDCKYHVKWSSASIHQNEDVSFTVVLTTKTDGKASTATPVRAEVYLTDTHPAPDSPQTSKETSTPGTYTVGPIRFDAPGEWTVRFHLHGDCEDLLADSPHGHAAFYLHVF